MPFLIAAATICLFLSVWSVFDQNIFILCVNGSSLDLVFLCLIFWPRQMHAYGNALIDWQLGPTSDQNSLINDDEDC